MLANHPNPYGLERQLQLTFRHSSKYLDYSDTFSTIEIEKGKRDTN